MKMLDMGGLVLLLGVSLTCLHPCRAFPNQLPDLSDPLLEYDQLDEELGEGPGRNWTHRAEDCGSCEPDLCPQARGCRAGLVPDSCGCCQECGNLEFQACDPGERNVIYGLCGSGLRCQADPRPAGRGGEGGGGDDEEEVCVCEEQEPVCATDGNTYMNMCQFREAAFSGPVLKVKGKGPCATVPVIKVPPQSQVNGTGSSLVLLCEVFAFPMALVEWRKEGRDIILPGDDPHISVQSRGGPLKFELSSWLQIERAEPGDSGTYKCIARNNLGSVSATAVLGVLGAEELSSYLANRVSVMEQPVDTADYDQDSY